MTEKEIEVKDLGTVIIKEFNNDDRELIQNNTTEITGVGRNRQAVVKLGTLNKYTFILGIVKAPFFRTALTDEGMTPNILKERLIEYKKLDYRIVETLIPAITELNHIDEEEFNNLKKS
jgi:hypothetical protein